MKIAKIRIIVVVTLLSISSTVKAKCYDSESQDLAQCRYPQGDQWCTAHYDGYPYAYKDDCVNAGSVLNPKTQDKTANYPEEAEPIDSEVEERNQRVDKYKKIASDTGKAIGILVDGVANVLGVGPTPSSVLMDMCNEVCKTRDPRVVSKYFIQDTKVQALIEMNALFTQAFTPAFTQAGFDTYNEVCVGSKSKVEIIKEITDSNQAEITYLENGSIKRIRAIKVNGDWKFTLQ